MRNEIIYAIVQAATEFLPVSSSGHLALAQNLISEPNLFLITMLHVASLFAVLIFTRKEINLLLTFNKEARKLWIYLIVATIPAALFGYFFHPQIERAFSSYLFLGFAFLFSGIVIYSTKFTSGDKPLNLKNTFLVGLMQILALFPGVSRSGITISTGLFQGINREKLARFSFLLLIPLVIGSMILETGNAYYSEELLIAFIVCFLASLLFLNLLMAVIRKKKFYLFGIYCFIVGLFSLGLYFFW